MKQLKWGSLFPTTLFLFALMKALEKWKMLFISSKNLSSFLIYSKFCLGFFGHVGKRPHKKTNVKFKILDIVDWERNNYDTPHIAQCLKKAIGQWERQRETERENALHEISDCSQRYAQFWFLKKGSGTSFFNTFDVWFGTICSI